MTSSRPSVLAAVLSIAAATMFLLVGFAAVIEAIDRSISRHKLTKIAHDLGVRIQQQQQKRK